MKTQRNPQSEPDCDIGATPNAAADLRRWLTPGISIDTLATACGVSSRRFRDWLEDGAVRDGETRRLNHMRAIVQALVLRRGAAGAVEWLLAPQADLKLRSPLDLLNDGEVNLVALALERELPHARPTLAGPMIAEDTALDFDPQERLIGVETTPRPHKRRRTAAEAAKQEAGHER